ncbi:MAG: aminoglycoside phosphotransferase family protein [Bdellovibrionaceae bacterium]|nr:aminoglycoside phosphotransferase family protein [Pseudobdellovibrionaceae bacterium]
MNKRPTWKHIPKLAIEAIESKFASRIVEVQSIDGGYSSMGRFQLIFHNGTHLFAKVDHSENTAKGRDAFRAELYNYQNIPQVANFGPEYAGVLRFEEWHFIFLQWIPDRVQTPPWSTSQVHHVVDRLVQLHSTKPSKFFGMTKPQLKLTPQNNWRRLIESETQLRSWSTMFEAPYKERAWLSKHQDRILELESISNTFTYEKCPVHLDLRSDNILISDKGIVTFVDWPYLTVGPRWLDLCFWLPGLEVEGGPPAEEVIAYYETKWHRGFRKEEIVLAAILVSGFFAFYSHQPELKGLADLRALQKRQFHPAYEWLKRVL